MRELTWNELAALDLPFVSAAVAESQLMMAWQINDSYAVLVESEATIWMALVGAPTKLDYVRAIGAASELPKPLAEVEIPTSLAEQLSLTEMRSWIWMWRDSMVRSLPLGCEVIAPGVADKEIERFFIQWDVHPSVMPGDKELQFWVTHRAADGELDAVAGGTLWHSNAAVVVSVAVAGNSRRQGLGAAVTQVATSEHFARGAKRVSLGVRGSNLGAIALYRKLGFDQEISLTSVRLQEN